MIELIVKAPDGNIYSLDVDQTEVIALTKSFLDLTDLESRSGDYTKGFGLPRTQTNDLVFGLFGDPSMIGAVWNPRANLPAWLIEDSNIISSGTLLLEESDPRLDRYQVSLLGDIATIKNIIGDGNMSEIDMTDWIYTPDQVFSTWDRSLFGGDMVFPVHDFGFGYGLYRKAGTDNVLMDIKTTATPLILDQTIPSFRVNALLRKIFEGKTNVLTGSWFDEAEVEEIYVQAASPLQAFAQGAALFTARIVETMDLDDTVRVLKFGDVPESADFDNVLNRYTAPIDGDFSFELALEFAAGKPPNTNGLLYFRKNGVNDGSAVNFNWRNNLTVPNRTMTLAAGDYVDITIQMLGSTEAGIIFTGAQNYWNLTNVVSSGAAVNPSSYWAGTTQLGFFKSIIQRFNLVTWIDQAGEMRIDTFDYFYANFGKRKDWTEKLDVGSVVVSPINSELRNPINLELEPADNLLNEDYRSLTGRAYGTYREDTGIPNTQGIAKAIEGFSPAVLSSIKSGVPAAAFIDFVVAKYYTDEDSLSYKSPGLQLMYYNGVRTTSESFYTTDSAGGATTARTGYPYFSNFRLYAVDSWKVIESTLDLNFTWWTPPDPTITTAASDQGVYNRYFREMLRAVYDEANKIVRASFILGAADLNSFSFADKIEITLNGTPVGLLILDIEEYVPGRTSATRVRAMLRPIDTDL